MAAPTGAQDGEGGAVDAILPSPFLGGFLRETRILYQEEVGGWIARGEKFYDQPALGVSVRFAHEDSPAWIDVFFYPAGVIDQEAFARAAEAERDSLREARLQSGEQEPDLSPLRPFLPGSVPGSGSGPGPESETTPPGYSRALAPRLEIHGSGHCWDAPLGDGRHGRDVPGCVGRESPELETEPGMRQIRIEYPPPAPLRLVPRAAVEMG